VESEDGKFTARSSIARQGKVAEALFAVCHPRVSHRLYADIFARLHDNAVGEIEAQLKFLTASSATTDCGRPACQTVIRHSDDEIEAVE
jgi:hypothetical protein